VPPNSTMSWLFNQILNRHLPYHISTYNKSTGSIFAANTLHDSFFKK